MDYGILFPDERVPGDVQIPVLDLHTSQFQLIENMRELGLPLEVTVANGLPQYAVFEIKTEAGLGHKRIKLN
jgi:hypothetical protein